MDALHRRRRTCLHSTDYSRFAYLSGALTEFRTLVHYRLRSAPLPLRLLLRRLYRPAATLTLEADRIGPALFIQHGVGTIVTAESIGATAGSTSRSPSDTTPRAGRRCMTASESGPGQWS